MTIVFVTFSVVFLLVLITGLLVFYRENVVARLANVVAPANLDRRWWQLLAVKPQSAVENLISPFERVLPRSPEEASVVQKRLIRAGFRQANHVNIFYGTKVLTPLILCVLVTVTSAYHYGAFFAYALAAGLGFLLPDFVLGNLIS